MAQMTNLDLKKKLKHLYAPSAKQVSVVDVPPMNYLMIDGEGNPNTAPRYLQAVEALYSLAYGIRAVSKQAGDIFTVMPLEGLWSIPGATGSSFHLTEADKDQFIWTLMILQPEHVTSQMLTQAREQMNKKMKTIIRQPYIV